MANLAYLSVWCKEWSADQQLELLVKFLATVPHATERPGFTRLVVRAMGPGEAPLAEYDLRARPADAVRIGELAAEQMHTDSAFEVEAHWDLWVRQAGQWVLAPQRLEIFCYGEGYDEGFFAEAGHFQVNLGFEHLFTGHAGLLGMGARPLARPAHPAEEEFLRTMTQPGNLRTYHEKTRENIRHVYRWMMGLERALPVARIRLWSEGEENLEARLEEILAVR